MEVANSPAQSSDELGLSVQTITSQLAEQFKLKSSNGVGVTEITDSGNRKAVKNAIQFKRIIKDNSAQKNIVLLILNDRYQHNVVLKERARNNLNN